MNVTSLALVVAALCVNFGWQPSPEDPQAYEVVMQVEPELVGVLSDGRQIPIESHVPASVTPIRNIRVVVGTDELPRKSIANRDRVVRGQEPLEHTARFQSDDGWSGGRYSPTDPSGSRQFDQRGPAIGAAPAGAAETDPWMLDSAQQAATNAGNSLRDSVNSGAQQVNQQGQQMLDSVQNSSRDFGQQLQSMSGFGGQSPPPSAAATSGSTAGNWPAPPPLASPQSTPITPLSRSVASPSIAPDPWTSIRPELAPPRLTTPPMPDGTRIASAPAATRAAAGPSFPAPPLANDSSRSLLNSPATTSSQTAEQDWSSIWGTGSNASSQPADSDVGLLPVPPRPRGAASGASPTATMATPPSIPAPVDNRYVQQAPPTQPSMSGADQWANSGHSPAGNFDPRPTPTPPPQSQPFAAVPQNPPLAQPGQATIGTQPLAGQQGTQAAPGEEVPWKPLLGVSLALAGSVGANFFLGMSYADARRRYRSLVAKTTHAFQKEAGIAA